MMKDMAPEVSCRNCAHHDWNKVGTCKAFPEGIPEDIAYGRFVHHVDYPEDNGVHFEHWTKKVRDEQQSFPDNMTPEE
jgi:hypothetical protein